VRGIFVHPNQLRYAVSQVPGIARVQGVITRPENRDGLTLRVVPAEESADRDELTAALTAAVRSVCRVRVDHVQFVPTDALGEKAETLVDERTWE
jgi:phenylacetate-CoA ligase